MIQAIIDSAVEGWYRFLDGHQAGDGHGVSGIEDTDWQATYNATDHNEYLGFSSDKESAGGFSTLGNTMTAYCCGCHGNFHIEQSGSSWIRHPSDAVIPNRGEYSSFTTYDPVTPVARPDLSSISNPGQIRLDTDMVMCLSCHKPHGSPYSDMLRWNYDGMIAGGGGSGGCFNCHTQKNQNP
jgi:predicted CXXCH cytochrome family protein